MGEVDDEAIALARKLTRTARHGALATIDPEAGAPLASRVATATDTDGAPVVLISDLARHASALRAEPRCSLLLGEPGKGDPLAHTRISLQCSALFLERNTADHARVSRRYLNRHPKASLYAGFGDFFFIRLQPVSADLNGGFARAFTLDARQLLLERGISGKIAGAEQSAIDHMNEDHGDAVDLLARHHANAKTEGWCLTGFDPEGFDIARAEAVVRGLFAEPLKSPAEIRQAFVLAVRLAGSMP